MTLLNLDLRECWRDALLNLVGLVLIIHDKSQKVFGQSQLELSNAVSFLDSDLGRLSVTFLLSTSNLDEVFELSDSLGLKIIEHLTICFTYLIITVLINLPLLPRRVLP